MNKETLTITSIEIFKMNINLHEPFVIAVGTQYDSKCVAIKIHTNQDISGFGEASPLLVLQGETQETCIVMAKIFSKILIGKNPLEIEARISEIEKVTPWHHAIKSAFDMALYDIASKYANMPLYQFLGGSNTKELIIDKTVVIDTPQKMAEKSKKLTDEGITEIKVKLGKNAIEDIERIRQIRETIGDKIPLKIDANQGWTESEALTVLNGIVKYNVEYAEQPIHKDDIEGLSRISSASPIPIMADEALFTHRDAIKLVKADACKFFNIKLSKSGGIYNALKILAIAESSDIKCQVGCMMETRLGLTALSHFAMASKSICYYDIDSNFLINEDPVIGGIKFVDDKKWILDDNPGIGAEFEPKFLNTCEKILID